MTPEEVAGLLNVSIRLVQKMCLTGQLDAIKVGTLWRIRSAEPIGAPQRSKSWPAISTNGAGSGISASRSEVAIDASAYEQAIGLKQRRSSHRR